MQELTGKERVVQEIAHIYQLMGTELLKKAEKMHRTELLQYASAYQAYCRHFTTLCDNGRNQMLHFQAELRAAKSEPSGDSAQRRAVGKLATVWAKITSDEDGA